VARYLELTTEVVLETTSPFPRGALEIIGVVLAPAKLQNRKIKVDSLADRRLPAHKPTFPR